MSMSHAEMTFGIGDITYTELYGSTRTISGGPNDGGLSFASYLMQLLQRNMELQLFVGEWENMKMRL